MNLTNFDTNPKTVATGDSDIIASAVMSWIVNPLRSQHCTITGGPGAGKTHLIKELVTRFRKYEELKIITKTSIHITGTTHESIAVLARKIPELPYYPRTFYSLLSLIPIKGVIKKKIGKKLYDATYTPSKAEQLDSFDWQARGGSKAPTQILICDESNFISDETLTIVNKWFPTLRIIFVGSENQLGMGVGPSSIFTQGWDNFYLNTNYRASNQEVLDVYNSSEKDVVTKAYAPSYLQNSSIVYLNTEDWEGIIKQAYTSEQSPSFITLAHKNLRVFDLVGQIRKYQGRPGFFDISGPTQGLYLGSSNIRKKDIKLERDDNGDVYIPIYTAKGDELRSYVGKNYFHYLDLKKDYKTSNRFNEIYPSLVASTQAMTIHGAQGGTWDYVFLDLVDLLALQKYDPETFRRAKHVAESRHRKKIYIRSEL